MRREALDAYLQRVEEERARDVIVPRRRRAGERAPASFAQRQLWLHARLAPGAPVYNESITIHRDGPLDVAALEQGLAEILRRHEAWRTTFAAEDGELWQVVHDPPPVRLPVDDLSELPPDEREREALRLATDDARRPFDLERGPLVRPRLVRLTRDRHRLFLALHHIVFDGVSIYGVLLPELAALHEAFAAGRRPALPEPPVQYADFAAWQHAWVESVEAARQLDFWRARLADAPGALPLPVDRPRPAAQTFAGAMERLAIPPALADALKAAGRREGATFYMTMLAAFATVLHRYSGHDDIVLGSVTSGRKRPEVEALLGYFVNPVALRLDLSGDAPFTELLRRVRDAVLDALANDGIPFERVVAAVRPDREAARNPLFQVMFSMEPAATPPAGWRITQPDVETGASKMDLYLEMEEQAGRVAGRFFYSTDLFDAATIRRMAGHLSTLLEGIAADPTRRLLALPLLTPAERHRLLVEWNRTEAPYPATSTVHEVFAAAARRDPRRVAVVHESRRMTYAELDARASGLAHRLRALGVGPDRRVAVAMERSPELIVALLAILKAGGAYVPLDPSYPPGLLRFMLDDADAAAVITDSRLLRRLPEARPVTVCLDAIGAEALAAAGAPRSHAGPDHLAYAIYTSGSTGRPKGVAVPHRAVLRLLFGADYVSLGPDEVLLQAASVSFDASVFEIWGALLHGGRLVLFPERVPTPAALREIVRREGVTTLWLTASLFNEVMDADPGALAGVRQLLTGGEPLSAPHVRRALERLPGTRLVNGYGPTETCVFACCHAIVEPPGGSSVPIGRPIANTRVYVLDRAMQPVPVGVLGELHVGGPGVARGYLRRPDLTAERFVPDPYGVSGERLYRTGDLARWRADGTIEFAGRMDNQVKIRGFRVEPGEIEAVLGEHPGVLRATVTTTTRGGDRALVAHVVPRPGQAVPAHALRQHLADRLPPHMVPSSFVILDALPLTPSGKVDRRALPAPAPERGDIVAPRDPLEAALARRWEDLLGVRPVGVTDDFFQLGGHSLLAVRLVRQIEELCGVTLPLATLYARTTVESLAAAIVEGDHGSFAEPVVTLNGGGTRPPLFFFHGDLDGGGFYCVRLARHLGPDQPLHVVHPLGLRGGDVPPTIPEMAEAHVRALRAVQPAGPYRLGGYCNGGLVAFETACRLEREGERVDLVALVAAVPDTRLAWLDAALGALPGREGAGRWVGRARTVLDRLRQSAPAGRARVLLATALRLASRDAAGRRPPAPPPSFSRYPELYDAYFDAVRSYVPRRCEAPLVVLWPAGQPRVGADDGTLGWGRLASSVRVESLPGDHNTIVTEHVALVAGRLAEPLAMLRGTAVEAPTPRAGRPRPRGRRALAALVRRGALSIARPLVRAAVATGPGLRAVNAAHARLPLAHKRRFFHYFGEEPIRLEGAWTATIAGRRLRLPLHQEFALSWSAVLAFEGYDVEVHAFYEALLRSPAPPRAVLDVGANHGLHSLKFLAHGARVVSVEPNPACHAYLREACALNGLACEIAPVALGEHPGTVELAIPDGLTYLATTTPGVRDRWASATEVATLGVPQTTVDDLVAARGLVPDLLKIDTEGNELAVLRGARRTLASARPLVVFESWRGDGNRKPIFEALDAAAYGVDALRFPHRAPEPMSPETFLASPATNFVAFPRRP